MIWEKIIGELHAPVVNRTQQAGWLGWDGWVNISHNESRLISENQLTTGKNEKQ